MRRTLSCAWLLAAALLASCGGGGGGNSPPPVPTPMTPPNGLSYASPQIYAAGTAITALNPSVTGSVTGYTVAPALPVGLTLAANGSITGTPTTASAQATYVVTASNSAGAATFNLVITVNGTFTVGGTVSGLTGSGLVLTNNGVGSLSVTANGAFIFAGAITTGAPYAVAVGTQPTGQSCAVSQGNGTMGSANVANVAITCSNTAAPTYTIGGAVSGLTGTGLVVRNNGSGDLSILSNGGFAFAQPQTSGSAYLVSVFAQPSGQTCSLAQANGNVGSANITNVSVTCVAIVVPTFAIGGNVTGLTGGTLVLRNNGGDDRTISASGAFEFAGRLTTGANYAVTVATQPAGQTCNVGSGSGVVGSADVSNVIVICAGSTATLGGNVLGLAGSGLRIHNGVEEIAINANGTFTFANLYGAGINYRVYVTQAPSSPAQTCAIINGIGTTTASATTNIGLVCVHTPSAGRFVYVPNYFGNSMSAFTVNQATGALAPVAGSPFTVANQPFQLAPHPNRLFLYTRSGSTNNIQAFAINQTTGALSTVPGSPFAAGAGAGNITMERTGRYLVVANTTAQTLSVFSINGTTGVLTHVTGSPYTLNYTPSQTVIRPDGRFLYVSDPSGNEIKGYRVDDATNALTPLASAVFTTHSVGEMTIDALGRFLYGTTTQNSIYAGRIDSTTGAVLPINISPTMTGIGPRRPIIDPLGRFLYIALTDAPSPGAVTGFAIDQNTGAITPAGPVPTVNTGNGILQPRLTIRGDARFMYAATLITESLHAFEIDSSSGQLYGVPGSPFPTSAGPNSVTLDPGGRWVYVTNAVTNTISVYATSLTTGALTAVPGSPFATGNGPFDQVVVQ